MLKVAEEHERWSHGRWLFLLVAGSIVALVLSFSGGVALGLLSSRSTLHHDAFSSGTVSLSSSAGSSCLASNLLPGATPASCTLTANYQGTAPGYLGIDVLIETKSGNGGTKLYNPSDQVHALQVSVTSAAPSVTFTVPTIATTCPSGAPSGSTCYEIDHELVSTTPLTAATAPVTFSTSVSLPSGTTTGYRGGTAQVIVTAHAVQSSHNGSTASCVAGSRCDTTSPGPSSLNWSS